MIHGSVDTLPHKGHKRMFLINARRSLLVQGLLVIGIALWMIYQYILPALNWCLFDWLEPPNTYITKDAHQKMPWFTCRCFIDYITFDFGYVSRIIVENRNRFYRNLWFICKYWERLAHKLSGRIFKIFFTEGYIVYSSPREKYPLLGVVPIEARESRSNAPCPLLMCHGQL